MEVFCKNKYLSQALKRARAQSRKQNQPKNSSKTVHLLDKAARGHLYSQQFSSRDSRDQFNRPRKTNSRASIRYTDSFSTNKKLRNLSKQDLLRTIERSAMLPPRPPMVRRDSASSQFTQQQNHRMIISETPTQSDHIKMAEQLHGESKTFSILQSPINMGKPPRLRQFSISRNLDIIIKEKQEKVKYREKQVYMQHKKQVQQLDQRKQQVHFRKPDQKAQKINQESDDLQNIPMMEAVYVKTQHVYQTTNKSNQIKTTKKQQSQRMKGTNRKAQMESSLLKNRQDQQDVQQLDLQQQLPNKKIVGKHQQNRLSTTAKNKQQSSNTVQKQKQQFKQPQKKQLKKSQKTEPIKTEQRKDLKQKTVEKKGQKKEQKKDAKQKNAQNKNQNVQKKEQKRNEKDDEDEQNQLWTCVTKRTTLISHMAKFVINYKKLIQKIYPPWILSSLLVYKRFYNERLVIQKVLEGGAKEDYYRLFGRKCTAQQLQQLREDYEQQISDIKTQNSKVKDALNKILTMAKKQDLKTAERYDKLKPHDINFDMMYDSMLEEINSLFKHPDKEVKVYLCHKVDSLLIVRHLDREAEFDEREKEAIEQDPQKYLVRRIEQLNNID